MRELTLISPANVGHRKKTMALRNFFNDKFLWIPAIIGLILMLLTLHFDINPVEGSVVPEYIQGTGVHIFLFISSMPAWIVAIILPGPFPVMACFMQIIIYGALGKIIGRGIDSLRK